MSVRIKSDIFKFQPVSDYFQEIGNRIICFVGVSSVTSEPETIKYKRKKRLHKNGLVATTRRIGVTILCLLGFMATKAQIPVQGIPTEIGNHFVWVLDYNTFTSELIPIEASIPGYEEWEVWCNYEGVTYVVQKRVQRLKWLTYNKWNMVAFMLPPRYNR